MHSATRNDIILDDLASGRPEADRTNGIGGAILDWLARIADRTPAARSAERYQRLNALSDEELARLDLTRHDLLEVCFGARALY